MYGNINFINSYCKKNSIVNFNEKPSTASRSVGPVDMIKLTYTFRKEDLRLAGEDWSPKKWVEAGMNYGSWQLIDRSGKNS